MKVAMSEIVGIVLLAIHLLSVNLASAGPLIAVWLWRAGNAKPIRRSCANSLLWKTIVAFLLGMITGGLLMAWSPSADLRNILGRFPARTYYFAAAELAFSLVCMLALAWSFAKELRSPWLLWGLALLTTTNLIYHFPPLMAVLGKLAVNPHWSTHDTIERAEQLQLMKLPEIVALSLHFAAASIAITAIAALDRLRRELSESPASPEAAQVIRNLVRTALLANLFQLPVGLWLLTSLSLDDVRTLMGGSLAASLSFIVALGLTLVLLQRLVALGWGLAEGKDLSWILKLTVLIVLLMTASLRLSRIDHGAVLRSLHASPTTVSH